MNPTIEVLQKAIDEKKESYRNHLKTHNHLAERMSEETNKLQSLTKDIDSLGQSIHLINNSESNNTAEKNAPTDKAFPGIPDDLPLGFHILGCEDVLKILKGLS